MDNNNSVTVAAATAQDRHDHAIVVSHRLQGGMLPLTAALFQI